MNEQRLSRRLEAISHLVPKENVVADIGTDHAYLPIHLVLSEKTKQAIAVEVNEGPYQSARAQVKRCGLEAMIAVRKGDGLSVIDAGEVDVLVIAGMGGALIQHILDQGLSKLKGIQRLILQPNVAAHLLRIWLREHGWELKQETVVQEQGHFYEILMAEPGDAEKPYRQLCAKELQKALLLGPFLLNSTSKAFKEKCREEYRKKERILKSLEQATGDVQSKRKQLKQEISLLKEVFRS